MFKSCMLSVLVASLVSTVAWAQPSRQVDQAINGKKASEPTSEADRLLREGDNSSDRKDFNKAIELYGRAYRLAPNNQSAYVRLLVAKRNARKLTPEDREALDLYEAQQAGQIQQTFRSVQLAMLQARQALKTNDGRVARVKVAEARKLLRGLPPEVDVGIYNDELSKLSRQVDRLVAKNPDAGDANSQMKPASANAVSVDEAAAEPRRDLQLSDEGDDMPTGDISAARVSETGEVINGDDVVGRECGPHRYDRAMTLALQRTRVDWLLNNNEAALAPVADITYPADWPAMTANRAKYKDGVLYEGQPFTGTDGQTYFTAIYDLGDLVQPIPNFYAAYPATAREQRNQDLDRQYLRDRSEIFNGYPEDLAAGLPLLHFFGGIDNNAVSTRVDPNEVARVVQTIESFLHSQSAPQPAQ